MAISENRLIQNYLTNLHVNVTLSGYSRVAKDWRDMDYVPEYNKFYLIKSGEGWVRIEDKEYYPMPGQLFLMPQGVKQSYSAVNENTYTKHWCHFTAKVGDMNLFDILQVPLFTDVKDWSTLESIFFELHDNFRNKELHAPLLLQSSILKLISFYLCSTTEAPVRLSRQHSKENINEVLHYIENNFHKAINIEALAKVVHLNPQYFMRLFKKQMGTSPMHYLNNRRMEEAKRLLDYTDLPVQEIAEKIGISNIYYFSRVFKQHTGFSPTAYRQLMSPQT